MKTKYRTMSLVVMATLALAALAPPRAAAQVLTGEQLKKAVPNSFFYAGQSATVQERNSAGLKNPAGKLVLAGLVDTSGYATAIAEKFQGFLITEVKIGFEGKMVGPGAYGFGFKDGKFLVMDIGGNDVLSVASKSDDQLKHPVPLKFERIETEYRLYAGRNYVAVKVD